VRNGYQGPGGKTVLAARTGAKLDFRLVPDQDPETILTLLRRHLTEQGFADVEAISLEASSRPAQGWMETALVETLVRSARYVYGVEPHVLPRRSGSGPMEELCSVRRRWTSVLFLT
jgi:acetylornithine deacetylase/succinyl-diaminopimelate desuccinylase-like protein